MVWRLLEAALFRVDSVFAVIELLLVGKNWPEFDVMVAFMLCLIDTCLLPS